RRRQHGRLRRHLLRERELPEESVDVDHRHGHLQEQLVGIRAFRPAACQNYVVSARGGGRRCCKSPTGFPRGIGRSTSSRPTSTSFVRALTNSSPSSPTAVASRPTA